MNLQNRIELIGLLSDYLKKNDEEWKSIKSNASSQNPWFTENFINLAAENVLSQYFDTNKIKNWVSHYHLDDLIVPQNIGIVMAGNIPMVGCHDFLSVFISGHRQTIKFSSKDNVLLNHLIHKLYEFDSRVKERITIADNLKGCDAYIATGSNQSATHFRQYFEKYPHIIRSNRTSIALLDGTETSEELLLLSKDIHTYFGLGCRNVTKIFVPYEYDFIPLLHSFKEFTYFRDFNKYSNNYDYQLSLLLLNNVKYMTNESTLLIEESRFFSPISVLHYEFYKNKEDVMNYLQNNEDIQCMIGHVGIPFGNAQMPDLFSYADGVDTMQFLISL